MLSNFLEPCQVFAGSSTATTPYVVWALEVPPGPHCFIYFVAVGACASLVNDQVLVYNLESREATVCKFLALGNYMP